MNMIFTKMSLSGNDFIVVDNLKAQLILSQENIIFLCDRKIGIGADGLILIEPSLEADCFMNYWNSDGSSPEICGDGVLCVAKFLGDTILRNQDAFKILTRSGVKSVKKEENNFFSVHMGKPTFLNEDFPSYKTELEGLSLDFVSLGNPHAVAFVENIKDFDIKSLGPKIENNSLFPHKINLELVQQDGENELSMKVWERGVGATLSCGSGACAVYALARKNKKVSENVIVNVPGGKLFISENKQNEIIMCGEPNVICTQEIEIA